MTAGVMLSRDKDVAVYSRTLTSRIKRMLMKTALTIAGSDSGGGAGVQADLKTFEAHNIFGVSVVSALTAQNTRGVKKVHPAPADFVAAQLDAVNEDFEISAIKIGMLFNAEIINIVAQRLERYKGPLFSTR